ncbi:MAG: hypothetical protein CMJ35_15585 [Phycisphaerae bacterium]|nr:hypothetical protein [Phycisphaerae bacterium]MBM93009.1 hypothetical protein [Phycisphaerae bacterium]|tara:strand:- start:109 stop:654 length:546 start_codon:yes stop_codon:yes gene_type:complete
MTQAAALSTTARLLLNMSERTTGLAAGLVQGIDPSTAASKPSIDGKVVDCNHATFIIGHLAIYPAKIMGALGAELGESAVPASYDELFEAGLECKHDPECTIYPAFGEVVAHFQRAHGVVQAQIAKLDDETLTGEIGGSSRAAEFFVTRDVMSMFMLHDHYMFHLGQLSTWRRCMGLGSVM